MSTTNPYRSRTVATLLRELGDIPAARVRLNPAPGTATVSDLDNPDYAGCELVNGVLVEKPMGWEESFLESWLIWAINDWVLRRNLGAVTGPDATVKLFPTLARIPDVAFTSWGRMPGRRRPVEKVPELAPDLAIEVLSESNTAAEMALKRTDYFGAGVLEVWEIDPRARTVRVYTAADRGRDLGPADALDGGTILPGLRVPVADLFAELDRHG